MNSLPLIPVVAVLGVFGIPIVAIICGTVVALKKKQATQNSPEDAKLMQEIHQGLSRMEQRIEALETILYDQQKRDR